MKPCLKRGQRVTFTTHPCLTPPLGRIPFEFLDKTYPAKTRGIGLLYGKNCMILTSTVFDWSTRVTNRRTDRQICDSKSYSAYCRALKRVPFLCFSMHWRVRVVKNVSGVLWLLKCFITCPVACCCVYCCEQIITEHFNSHIKWY